MHRGCTCSNILHYFNMSSECCKCGVNDAEAVRDFEAVQPLCPVGFEAIKILAKQRELTRQEACQVLVSVESLQLTVAGSPHKNPTSETWHVASCSVQQPQHDNPTFRADGVLHIVKTCSRYRQDGLPWTMLKKRNSWVSPMQQRAALFLPLLAKLFLASRIIHALFCKAPRVATFTDPKIKFKRHSKVLQAACTASERAFLERPEMSCQVQAGFLAIQGFKGGYFQIHPCSIPLQTCYSGETFTIMRTQGATGLRQQQQLQALSQACERPLGTCAHIGTTSRKAAS